MRSQPHFSGSSSSTYVAALVRLLPLLLYTVARVSHTAQKVLQAVRKASIPCF